MKVEEWRPCGGIYSRGNAETYEVEKELLEKSIKMLGHLIDGDITNYDDMYLKLSALDEKKIKGVFQQAIYQMNRNSNKFHMHDNHYD